MKSIGIVRGVDELGRVVIPKELRNILAIEKKTPLEIFVENDLIILRKYAVGCLFCGETKNTKRYKDQVICQSCIDSLK